MSTTIWRACIAHIHFIYKNSFANAQRSYSVNALTDTLWRCGWCLMHDFFLMCKIGTKRLKVHKISFRIFMKIWICNVQSENLRIQQPHGTMRCPCAASCLHAYRKWQFCTNGRRIVNKIIIIVSFGTLLHLCFCVQLIIIHNHIKYVVILYAKLQT